MDILQAIQKLRPETTWTIMTGERLVQAGGTPVDPPSQNEIQAVLDAEVYKEKRAAEYPSLTDLADALVHKENGDPTFYNAYIDKYNAIKAKYPK